MFLIVSQSVSQAKGGREARAEQEGHSREPLGEPSARVFEVFLIVSQRENNLGEPIRAAVKPSWSQAGRIEN